MLALFRPSYPSVARQYHLQPIPLQQMMRMQKARVRRSMATKRDDPEKGEYPDPSPSPSGLFERLDRATAAYTKQYHNEKVGRMSGDIKRAEAQLLVKDMPQRRRALDRMYADLAAEQAWYLVASDDLTRRMHPGTDMSMRELVRLYEEQCRRAPSYYKAKTRSISLWLFAPLGDVGLLRRLASLLGYIGQLPRFLLCKLYTSARRQELSNRQEARRQELRNRRRQEA
jgi:hypothetical protein